MAESDAVMAIGDWRDNAEMIAAVAKVNGYLDGTVLDATYGQGTFWRDFKPEHLTTSDLFKPADHAWDYLNLPCADGAFDSVVFDPEYKLNGTPALGEFDEKYGIGGENVTREMRLTKIVAGAVECYRVSRKWLLVKCQDQVEGGIVRWQTDLITDAIKEIGGRKADRFDLTYKPRPQPTGWRATAPGVAAATHPTEGEAWAYLDGLGAVCGKVRNLDRGQKTARRNHSTLLVFQRKEYIKPVSPERLLALEAETQALLEAERGDET